MTPPQKILLSDCFTIEAAVQDDKMKFDSSDIGVPDAVPFVGRSGANNGVVGYVTPREGLLNEAGCITVALDGSTGSTFYQPHPFCCGQNIWVLKPTKAFERFAAAIALYCVTSIRKAVRNYGYNLSLTKARLMKINVLLPLASEGQVDVDKIESEMEFLRNLEAVSAVRNTRY
jgi:hypothetical protein